VKGVGGSFRNKSYPWKDLMFRNSSGDVLNISDADDAGWVDADNINYYDPDFLGGTYRILGSSDSLNSWEGYLVKSNKNNITMLRQD